jgi:formylglycine-generating enzyme required for sulfatase activity
MTESAIARWRTSCLLLGLVLAPSAQAEVVMLTESWASTDKDFAKCDQRIQNLHPRNLLARKGAFPVPAPKSGMDSARFLTDGSAGTRGADGRCFINGQPSVIAFYLGGPKTVKEVGAFTFNGDTRANQDYEVRFFDNSAHPGQLPQFRDQADLTTGSTIVGQDHGGFHTRFIDPQGRPLTAGKVDWVEFRIWRTYSERAGTPAKSNVPQGGSTWVEIEVLGEEHDVVVPSPAEIARQQAIRRAPPQPAYVKRPTWRETVIANREALLAWESAQDELALPDSGAVFGPWHVLGPLPRNGKSLPQIEQQKTVDLTKRYPGRDGSELSWQKRADLLDHRLIDLTAFPGAAKDDVVYLCREVTLERQLERNQFFASVGIADGWIRWLPAGQTIGMQGPAAPNAREWELQGRPGQCQMLVRLNADRHGQRRMWLGLQTPSARPGAGTPDTRVGRRTQLLDRVRRDFPDRLDQAQMRWELADGLWPRQRRQLSDWVPGESETHFAPLYRQALSRRLAAVKKDLTAETGVLPAAIRPAKERIAAWTEQLAAAVTPAPDSPQSREKYYRACAVHEALTMAARVRSLRLAVEDQRRTFPDRYPRGDEFLRRASQLEGQLAALWDRVLSEKGSGAFCRNGPEGAVHKMLLTRFPTDKADPLPSVLEFAGTVDQAGRDILLANPVLQFDKLLLVKGSSSFAANWTGPNHLGNEIVVLAPVRPDGTQTTVYRGGVSDMDLHWDGRRLLFCDGRVIWEMQTDGSGLRRVSQEKPPVTHYDACYLPNGKIVCVSNACEQAVPCTGGADVGNLHILDADGTNERRVTYDQDHDWNPAILNDGRVLYTRWEYTDLPHYFSRILFRMNPDGTGQMEYYGSNSYWPNAMYWARPIPGHPTQVVCIVSGHHGVSRVGELLLLDPERGRQEADGAIQRIPGYGQKVEPIILDNLVGDSWPKFATPYPLAEPDTNRGAGKYFLAAVKNHDWSTWSVCLVDVFDNITPILEGGYMMPIPLRSRPQPPVIPSTIDLEQKEATIYLADVYQGDGLRGYPRGSIKALRIGTHHYRYAGNGDTRASSFEGGWDVKRIMGTVPVHEDGSALFRVPANTPIFVQPLDAEGKAQQQMRSWYAAMPGEKASCIGCHERQNVGPISRATLAAKRKAVDITPWFGPTRGFSFDREVQPVLDRRCVGCHNGQPCEAGGSPVATCDLRAKRLRPDWEGDYSPAYMELQKYVRRAGYESDNHMHVPAEFEPDTSVLVQMLKKGHYNVRLSAEEWQRLYTWIDYNVPYPANWRESHRPPQDAQVARRSEYKKYFANIDDHDEDPLPLPPIAAFEAPPPSAPRPSAAPALEHWPLTDDEAKQRQQAAGPVERTLDLGDGVTMKFRLIPAGRFVMGDLRGFDDELPRAVVAVDRPFYLGQFEVTNRQYACFDPAHDNAYIEGRFKDRTTRGTPINAPEQPVVRISWNQAMAFCQWLSAKTGCRATLPTEAQWEWACRGGTSAAHHFGEYKPGLNNVANLADSGIAGWNYGRSEPGYSDGVSFTAPGGRYPANAWGLHDMHGNVAEWCTSLYKPYPYNAQDGREDLRTAGPRVVRGGSWNDTMRYATSASRWRYQPYQPVYNVGFRVLLEMKPQDAVAAR